MFQSPILDAAHRRAAGKRDKTRHDREYVTMA
jgi:hypothetical protein